MKREFTGFIFVFFVAGTASGDESWPQWLGPNRHGISTEKRTAPFLPVPRKLWSVSVGMGPTSVVVSSGRAHAMGHVKGPGERGTDTVFCLNAGDLACLEILNSGNARGAEIAVVRTSLDPVVSRKALLALEDPSEKELYSPPVPNAKEMQREWPRFRGPGGLGISPFRDIPRSFDVKTGKNILWKVPVTLPGEGSPVVWGKRIFLTGGNQKNREVYCFDADSGKLSWRKEVKPARKGPADKDREEAKILFAAATPVTDGKRVAAIFGTGDVVCLDPDGTQLWSRNLGMPENSYGHATSLEIWRSHLIVQMDQGTPGKGKSRLMALDLESGKMIWEAKRPVPASWTTPIVIKAKGGEQVITNADPWVIAYDPATGSEIWKAECQAGEVVPSPIFTGGLVFAASVDGMLAAIRPDGKGDVTQTHIAWFSEDDLPAITSPVSNGKLLFLLGPGAFLTCYQVGDGKKIWEKELDTHYEASPSLAGGLLYLLDEKGVLSVLKVGETCEPVSTSELGEGCQASPAFAPGRIYIRSKKHLWAIGDGGR